MINSITFTNPIKSIDCGFRFEIHQYFSFKSSFGRSFVRSLTLRKAFFMIICMVIRFALFAIEQIHLLLFCSFYFHSIPSIHHWLDDQLYCYLWICLFNSSWIFYAFFPNDFTLEFGLVVVFAMKSSTFDCRYDMLPFVSSRWGWPIGLKNIDCPPAILLQSAIGWFFCLCVFFIIGRSNSAYISINFHAFCHNKRQKIGRTLFYKSDQFETNSHSWVCSRALFSH